MMKELLKEKKNIITIILINQNKSIKKIKNEYMKRKKKQNF